MEGLVVACTGAGGPDGHVSRSCGLRGGSRWWVAPGLASEFLWSRCPRVLRAQAQGGCLGAGEPGRGLCWGGGGMGAVAGARLGRRSRSCAAARLQGPTSPEGPLSVPSHAVSVPLGVTTECPVLLRPCPGLQLDCSPAEGARVQPLTRGRWASSHPGRPWTCGEWPGRALVMHQGQQVRSTTRPCTLCSEASVLPPRALGACPQLASRQGGPTGLPGPQTASSRAGRLQAWCGGCRLRGPPAPACPQVPASQALRVPAASPSLGTHAVREASVSRRRSPDSNPGRPTDPPGAALSRLWVFCAWRGRSRHAQVTPESQQFSHLVLHNAVGPLPLHSSTFSSPGTASVPVNSHSPPPPPAPGGPGLSVSVDSDSRWFMKEQVHARGLWCRSSPSSHTGFSELGHERCGVERPRFVYLDISGAGLCPPLGCGDQRDQEHSWVSLCDRV